jgi:hypothetical protein
MNAAQHAMVFGNATLAVFSILGSGLDPLLAAEAVPDANDQVSPSANFDKSKYNLFLPTPREAMREMNTDRPDKTESAYTVDAGHFQLEMDFLSYTRDRDRHDGADTRVNSYAVAPVNLKLGLLNNLDFQLVLDTWNYVKTDDRVAGALSRQKGFGDVTTRLKFNVWGNDGGSTALALMPYVKLPSNQDHLGNNAVEGGLIIPMAVKLPLDFDMGLMTKFDCVRDSERRAYHPEFVNTVTVSHDIAGKLGGYLEFYSQVSTEANSRWIGTVDMGLTYELSKDVQLDAGINMGVTDSADDLNPFVGISLRF